MRNELTSRIVRAVSVAGRMLLCAVLVFQPAIAMANPLDGTVVQGSATISSQGPVLTVNQTTQRAVINWKSFSVEAGETTIFNLPNSQSAVLNRVTGGNPSAIYGTIQSNGKVFLLNPNGILVGSGANINVHSFVASTLNVPDQEFMEGKDLNFSGNSTASIVNRGDIRALEGDIFLIAASVENHGLLQAPLGKVSMAAGMSVKLVDSAHPALVVNATEQSLTNVGLLNSGVIEAAQAELITNGGNVFGLAINNTGTIRATGVENRDGRILLVAPGGKISNSGSLVAKNGQDGGVVDINAGTGANSEVSITGTIDVSGERAGGVISIRGDKIDIAGATLNTSGETPGAAQFKFGENSIEITPIQGTQGGDNVKHVDGNLITEGVTVQGTTDDDFVVNVTSDSNGITLKIQGGGQAQISGVNQQQVEVNVPDFTITTEPGEAFTSLEFNLQRQGGPTNATIDIFAQGYDADNNPIQVQLLGQSLGPGANRFLIQGTEGYTFTSVSVKFSSQAIARITQIRVTPAVQDPGPPPGPSFDLSSLLLRYDPIFPVGNGNGNSGYGDEERDDSKELAGQSSNGLFAPTTPVVED